MPKGYAAACAYMLSSASRTNRWTSSISLIVSTRTRLESLLSLYYPERSRLLTLTTLELVGDPEQRPIDHGTVIAGQIDDAGFHDEAAEFNEAPCSLAALDLPCAHVMSRPCGLVPVARRSVAQEGRPGCGQLSVQFAPALKKRGPAPGPCLPLSGLFCLNQHDQRPRQFISAECVGSGSDHQLAKLLHFAALEVTCLVSQCFQFGVKVPWLSTIVSITVDGELIVQRYAECCKVVSTVWYRMVPPENFSREGALIRRADVRFAV
jgi:hypothetical protein